MNPLKILLKPFQHKPTCEEVNRFLVDYLEGSLPDKTVSKFKSHLDKCPGCIIYFEQYKKTIELVKDEDDVHIPDRLVEHTLEFLRANIRPN